MSSSTGSGLAEALENITRLDKEVSGLEAQIKEKKKLRDHFEKIALEEMQTNRLDGVKAAGRSWRIEIEHSVSVPSDVRDQVLAAAKALGLDDMVTIPTTSLKTYLRERAKEFSASPETPWAAGTEFDGLVSEYIRPVLRHQTVA